MNIEEARRWFASTESEALQQSLEDDTDTALSDYDRTSAAMAGYPAAALANYRRAASDLRAAAPPWNRAVQDLVGGRARDGRAALAAYRAYVRALLQLQAMNARNAAYVDAELAASVEETFVAREQLVSSAVRRETRNMMRNLERLRDRLNRLRRAEITGEGMRNLSAAFGTVGVALGMVTGLTEAAALFGVLTAAVSTALGIAVNGEGPDMFGAANTGTGVVTSLIDDLDSFVGTFAGVGGTFAGFVYDSAGIAETRREIEQAQREFEEAIDDIRRYARRLRSISSDISRARRAAESAARTAAARARAYRAVVADWAEIEATLNEIR